MSPINPNFKPGVGHLVTDRFDFQHHVDGTDFRHKAGAIDVSPALTIGVTTVTDVQTALATLANSINVPTVADATTTSKGIIQLGGDLGGTGGGGTTAANPRVSGLQGRPVSFPGSLTSGDVLGWNGSSWTNGPITPATQSTTGSVILAGDITGVYTAPTVKGIQGRSIASTAPTSGQVLGWNGSTWTPTSVIAPPTGTGFATVTSSAFDAAATANIRYTGGKFQTDVNIQFKNSTITGDLSWTPGSSNKILVLPDANDTLVGRLTTDTLFNKNINATNNTITDTGLATGDILAVVSGSKFSRLGKGSNGTFLGVSGGNLGYFTPTAGSVTAPTGTGFATVTSGSFDTAATTNIRYTAGKFQSDVSIQWKNSTITGDLSWTPSSSNKILILPDANDTLIGKTTTDILINKTINMSNNSLTDTSQATGDLIKNNGTNFSRFAKGTSLQVLRVNSGATDLEWATLSAGESSAGSENSIQLSDGSGGFLANGTLGVQSGGSLRVNITNTNVEYQVPVAGYAAGSIPFRMQFATVNATTGSGAYTLSSIELASPILVFSNTSSDGYIIIPNILPAGTIYFINNSASGDIKFTRPADYGINSALFSLNPGQCAILLSNGSTYIRISNLF